MDREKRFEFHETNVTLLWFLMDGLWMMGFEILPVIIAVPAVIIGCLIFVYADKTPHLLAVVVAGSTWMFMDVSWMVSENFEIKWLYILSCIMFWTTFLCLAYSVIKSKNYRESAYETLSGFRRMKIKK